MELSSDWVGFQETFYPRKRIPASKMSQSHMGPIHMVVQGNSVVDLFSENEDLSEWVGANVPEVSGHFKHRKIHIFTRDQMDAWMQSSLHLPHLYEQVEFLRSQAYPQDEKFKELTAKIFKRHFLLEAIHGWWSKIFPSSYGIFIRVESTVPRDFIVLVRKGNLEGFHRPDLIAMGPERRKMPLEVIKYLSERYLVPVQGIFVTPDEWYSWCNMDNPWKEIAKVLRVNRHKMTPFRSSLVTLAATRGFLGL